MVTYPRDRLFRLGHIVALLREHYGRGPMKAETYALDDIIVVVMRGSGFTPLEQTIMNSPRGRHRRVPSLLSVLDGDASRRLGAVNSPPLLGERSGPTIAGDLERDRRPEARLPFR